MSIILVTDPTADGFNSFVSLEQADEYFSGVYFGESEGWDTLDADVQARLLVTASRALSTLSWAGTASGRLAFPRTYPNQYIFEPVIPSFVVELVCEWAKWIWQEGPNREGSVPGQVGVQQVKIGDLDIKFGAPVMTGEGSHLPPAILALLTPLAPRYLSFGRARSLSMRY